jgi:hypothetical protein
VEMEMEMEIISNGDEMKVVLLKKDEMKVNSLG